MARSDKNGAGPTKMARVTSSEINYLVLIFKMAAILTKNSAIIRSNIVSFCGNSASVKLKLTDIN